MYTICNFCKNKKKIALRKKRVLIIFTNGICCRFQTKEWLIFFKKYSLNTSTSWILLQFYWVEIMCQSPPPPLLYHLQAEQRKYFLSRHVIKRFKDYNGRKKKWKQSKKKKWTCQTRTSRDLIAMQGNNWLHSTHN